MAFLLCGSPCVALVDETMKMSFDICSNLAAFPLYEFSCVFLGHLILCNNCHTRSRQTASLVCEYFCESSDHQIERNAYHTGNRRMASLLCGSYCVSLDDQNGRKNFSHLQQPNGFFLVWVP